jgi:hypothetical protein
MTAVKALAPAALIAVIVCAGAGAEDSRTSGGPGQPQGVPAQEFKAKAGYCETCHGLSARTAVRFMLSTSLAKVAASLAAAVFAVASGW